MKFIEAVVGMLALSGGMIFATFHFVMHWLVETAMLLGAAALIALNVFAILVWFVNWKYYPEGK